jgi:hypothetical protein
MLSFIKEHGLDDKLSDINTNNNSKDSMYASKTGQQKRQNPEKQEYLTVASKKQKVKNSTLLLIALFAAGLLCLLLMIKKSAPQAAKAQSTNNEEVQIETAISRLTGVKSAMFKSIERIVKKFYEFSDVKQIKVDELVKNPFENEALMTNLYQISDKNIGSNINQQALREQLLESCKGMQLLSIMKSDAGNCCVIDDKILYEGDTLRGFLVRKIEDDFVKLEPKLQQGQTDTITAETEQIILKLSE